MKKNVKRVLLILIPILILLIGAAFYMLYPMLLMNPTETGMIPGANIFAVKNNRNSVFFIKTENGYIMVDAGSDEKGLEASLKENEINADDVNWILITHSDYDHVASLPLFTNAEIYMGEDEIGLVNGTVKRNMFSNNRLPVGTDEITLLSDRQLLSFEDISVECIKMPGHTNGSMVYLIDGQYLFTGDAFKVIDDVIGIHPFTMDKETAETSIKNLNNVISENQIVIMAHYGYYTANELISED